MYAMNILLNDIYVSGEFSRVSMLALLALGLELEIVD